MGPEHENLGAALRTWTVLFEVVLGTTQSCKDLNAHIPCTVVAIATKGSRQHLAQGSQNLLPTKKSEILSQTRAKHFQN